MAANAQTTGVISPARLRLGVLLFVVWWIPLYLAIPAVVAALGEQGNHHATAVITVSIVALQTVVGLLGLWLLGKQLALTIKRVSYRRLPMVIWRSVWSGRTTIDPADLKPAKGATRKVQ
jgi:hypothetical protein